MGKMILFGMIALLMPFVLADYGGMMGNTGYGMMGSYGGWFGLIGILWLALAAFVVSVIFWLTYNWLVKGTKKEKAKHRGE